MSKNEIKAIASPMPGCPAWTVAVFKAVDVPEGTEVAPVQPVAVPDGWNPDGYADSKERCRKMLLRQMKDLGLSDGNAGWIEHSNEDGEIVRDALSFEGELLFAFQVIGDALQVAPAAQGDAKDEVYEFAAKVIELFDDATMRANHMLDAGECASIIRALKSTEIAAIAAKAAS